MEHVSMFLAQLGEASAYDFMKARNFPLSLTGIAFAWFTTLPSYSISSWAELEKSFIVTFIVEPKKLDCLILHRFVKGVMSLLLISLSDLERLKTNVFI
jgi:hypothetical protein